jgi:hypothetical protein
MTGVVRVAFEDNEDSIDDWAELVIWGKDRLTPELVTDSQKHGSGSMRVTPSSSAR